MYSTVTVGGYEYIREYLVHVQQVAQVDLESKDVSMSFAIYFSQLLLHPHHVHRRIFLRQPLRKFEAEVYSGVDHFSKVQLPTSFVWFCLSSSITQRSCHLVHAIERSSHSPLRHVLLEKIPSSPPSQLTETQRQTFDLRS